MTHRAKRLSRKTREEIGKKTQMTALRFQIGKRSMEEGVTSDNPGLPWGSGRGGRGEGNEAMSKLPAKVASSHMIPRRDGHTETRTTREKGRASRKKVSQSGDIIMLLKIVRLMRNGGNGTRQA